MLNRLNKLGGEYKMSLKSALIAKLKKYGLTNEQYEAMKSKTGNKCYICNKPPKSKALHIDHNHKSGKVRGLLCYVCNRRLIGKLGDRPDAVSLFNAAALYIAKNSDYRKGA